MSDGQQDAVYEQCHEGPAPAKLIVSLCDYSGVWSEPYVRAGYDVIRVDLKHGVDVLTFEHPRQPHGVMAAPPCTCFCRPSARWWARQDAAGDTERNVKVMRACLRLCSQASAWWAMENPPGRHQRLIPELGRPAWQYQPWEYGDAWGKQTYIWGTARKPPVVSPVSPEPTRRTPNGKTQGRIAFMSSSWQAKREQTPAGFARAFYEANP